jgi:acetyltransferase-like isoleucine patch superfamily enzyme/acyl carrier protein
MTQTPEEQKLGEQFFIRDKYYDKTKSSYRRYAELVLGDCSLITLLRYELITGLLGGMPGALGLVLRKYFYRFLFPEIGKGVVFGRCVVIRHPKKIVLGNGVVIDDYCLLDGRGGVEKGIQINERTIINRGATVQAKVGSIEIGADSSIGAGATIIAQGGVEIGSGVTIAGGCFVSGGAFERRYDEGAEKDHARYTRGPIRIGDGCHLAMHATVLDGVTLGKGAFVGAGAIVTEDVAENIIVVPQHKLLHLPSGQCKSVGPAAEPLVGDAIIDPAHRRRILACILAAVVELNRQLPAEKKLKTEESTVLFNGRTGDGLDSLDLVNIIVICEQKLEEEFNSTVSLTGRGWANESGSPFETIGDLADYTAAHLRLPRGNPADRNGAIQ